jgi:hypothetical protein
MRVTAGGHVEASAAAAGDGVEPAAMAASTAMRGRNLDGVPFILRAYGQDASPDIGRRA